MRIASVVLPLALLALAGCGEEPAASPPASAAPSPATATVAADAPVVLAFGDSLYAGYQLRPGESFPAQLERELAERGVAARVINAGVSGDTTAAGLQRLAFALDNQRKRPALVLVGLGGNDMLRGLPPAEARANLASILDELKRRQIPAMLTGMLATPNLGEGYVNDFNAIYPSLAREYDIPLVPFLLQPVIGDPQLMLADRIHPNAKGAEAIAEDTADEVAAALEVATAS